MLERDPVLAAHVTARLEAKDSPMTISRELAAGAHGVTARISLETICAGIYAQGRHGLRRGLHVNPQRSRRCRKRRMAKGEQPQRRSPLGEFKPIARSAGGSRGAVRAGPSRRGPDPWRREPFGDHHGLRSGTRMTWLADLPEDHGAVSMLAGLIELCERIPPELRRTLIWDQGREMALSADLETACNIEVYFADTSMSIRDTASGLASSVSRRAGAAVSWTVRFDRDGSEERLPDAYFSAV